MTTESDIIFSGKLFVFASPSGGGKNTIINLLREKHPELKYSISATTRPQSAEEIDGVHYYFISTGRFVEMIKRDELVEYEQVHSDYYGTPKGPIEDVIRKGETMLLDLDVKGALHLKKLYPCTTTIFLLPPSMEVLKDRLTKRRRESMERIEARLQAAHIEIAAADKFDYKVVNDDLDMAVKEVENIIYNYESADK
jgi:guanylate kinase